MHLEVRFADGRVVRVPFDPDAPTMAHVGHDGSSLDGRLDRHLFSLGSGRLQWLIGQSCSLSTTSSIA